MLHARAKDQRNAVARRQLAPARQALPWRALPRRGCPGGGGVATCAPGTRSRAKVATRAKAKNEHPGGGNAQEVQQVNAQRVGDDVEPSNGVDAQEVQPEHDLPAHDERLEWVGIPHLLSYPEGTRDTAVCIATLGSSSAHGRRELTTVCVCVCVQGAEPCAPLVDELAHLRGLTHEEPAAQCQGQADCAPARRSIAA